MLTEERYLLITLLSHRMINLYDFYAESNFSTGQIVRAVLKYQKKGYLFIFGKVIIRTPLGARKLKKKHREDLIYSNRYWTQLPEEITTAKVGKNEPIDRIHIPRK